MLAKLLKNINYAYFHAINIYNGKLSVSLLRCVDN